MNREFHAQFPFVLKDSLTQGFTIARLVGQSARLPKAWSEIAQISDDWARIEILSQAIITPRKEEARMGTRRMAGGLRYWIEKRSAQFLEERTNLYRELGLLPPLPDPSPFPPGSWAVQLTFTLRKPYISKDDVDFYILDNPVKKEWVFKVPYVAPSQWKGALRAAMIRDMVDAFQSGKKEEDEFVEERLRLYRLFGNEKDGTTDFLNRAWALHRVGPPPDDKQQAEEWERRFQETIKRVADEFERRLRKEGYRVGDMEGFQGRLHFYPTFFDRIGLEVINPHDRKTGTGKHPIYFECVPAGTQGTFTLLYVPLDLSDNPEEAQKQAEDDLKAVAAGLRAMLTVYGFGAKTSSGYGVADVIREQSTIQGNSTEDIVTVFWKEWDKMVEETP